MKEEALKRLAEIIAKDVSLPLYKTANLVFGEGRADAEVLFIGEAPGANEDKEMRPFVGRAGQLLRKSIRDLGWDERAVYITNIVKRRPPENRDPNEEEIAAYGPYLARQIDIIDPKVIVTLGRFSMAYFVPDAKITRDQGKVLMGRGRTVIPILHPAAALRAPAMLADFERTFAALPDILNGLGVNMDALRAEAPTRSVHESERTITPRGITHQPERMTSDKVESSNQPSLSRRGEQPSLFS
jgi:DNA polymerase